MKVRPANDDRELSETEDRAALLHEIALLRAELAQCAARMAELDKLAHVDPLVELFNRRSFVSSLLFAIRRVEEHGIAAAVLFLDVDGLKSINDQFGHGAGDQALIEVARCLVASVREGDVVARLAGDEFGILLESADELSARRMALRVVETVDQCEFETGGLRRTLSVSIGLSIIKPGDTPAAVIERADREMYRVRASSGPALASRAAEGAWPEGPIQLN